MRILVIDDEKDVLFAISSLLNSLGYQVETASSGKEGLEKLLNNNFEIVFLDIRMPEMDGIEVLKRIREKNIDVIPIILTAYGDLQTAIDAIKYGAYDFLEKPVTREMLRFSVERAKQRKELEEKNIRLKEYESVYKIYHELIKIENLENLIQKIPQVLYENFEKRFNIYLFFIMPFNLKAFYPESAKNNMPELENILEIPQEIKNEGITVVTKINERETIVKTYRPDEKICFHFAIEGAGVSEYDIVKKFEFICDEIFLLISKNYYHHLTEETLKKLKNIHLHSVKTGTLSLLTELSSEIFKSILSPFHSIENQLNTLKNISKEPSFRHILENIHNKISELKNTLKILESVSAIEQIVIEPVNIDDIIYISYEILSEKMKKMNIKFERKGEENLKAIANPAALQTCFIHIFLNSIDAMQFGGKIEVETLKENNKIIITVTDTGEGIDPQIIDKVFEPFFTTKKEKGGTGLGLTATKWLIEKMGGRVEIESQKNIGTTLKIFLKSA